MARGLFVVAALAATTRSVAGHRRHPSEDLARAAAGGALLEKSSAEFPVHPVLAGAAALAAGSAPVVPPGSPALAFVRPHARAAAAAPLRAVLETQSASAEERDEDKDEKKAAASSSDEEVLVLTPQEYPVMQSDQSVFRKWIPKEETLSVLVPSLWSRGFATGAIYEDDGADHIIYSGRANLKLDPKMEVTFRGRKAEELQTKRDLHMAKWLTSTGSVPTFFDSVEQDGVVYTLKESVGTATLEAWLAEQKAEVGKPFVGLERSLPIMMDLLRGVHAMSERGIVHGDIAEKHIFLLGKDRRCVIGDFVFARIPGDSRFGGTNINIGQPGKDSVTAYRHAPEMKEIPNSLSNNVWQLGLVFAHLLLGPDAVPNEDMAANWVAQRYWLDDYSYEGRLTIHDAIRDHYSVADIKAFKDLSDFKYGGLKKIVLRMLEKDPKKRATEAEVMVALEDYAKLEDIALPEPRRPAELPEGWNKVGAVSPSKAP